MAAMRWSPPLEKMPPRWRRQSGDAHLGSSHLGQCLTPHRPATPHAPFKTGAQAASHIIASPRGSLRRGTQQGASISRGSSWAER